MMITEHNCEEYFLLYIDNELSGDERKTVEDFIMKNPQYKVLFNALQETKLPADESLSFLSKESLYKDEAAEIGISNYEEYFLLYTDNELNKEQKETTERFVLRHPQLQEEFVLLQQTKLSPDIIGYKNKEELYKKERRIVPMYIAGLSVAAAVLAVLFFSGIMIPHQQHNDNLAARAVNHNDESSHQQTPNQVLPEDVAPYQKEQAQTVASSNQSVRITSEKRNVVTVTKQDNQVSNIPTVTSLPQPHDNETAISVIPEETQTPRASLPENKTTVKQVNVLKPLEEFNADQVNTTTALSLSDNYTAQPAVYKELNTDDDDHTLYVSGLPINKNKVNGFLKSASRLLGGHAKQSEE